MFGEAIDLRGGDCAAGARGGRVISLESPQSPLNPNLHTLMSLVLLNFFFYFPPPLDDILSDGQLLFFFFFFTCH